MHPSRELIGLNGNELLGRKIVIGITGSIAAVECVKLIHNLVRHGASVYPVFTEAACKIIDPEAVKYASGNKPITRITGEVEHVALCGQVKDKVDLFLIAPCTANTISKIACGIDDTTVTTFATTAIGSKIPIIIVPAMHGSMYEHPIIQDNLKKLLRSDLNIEIINPMLGENKYKMPSIDEISSRVIRKIWKSDFKGKHILVIAGATAEKIDDMRIITNRSTGNTGIALVKQAFLRGAEVEIWLSERANKPPDFINSKRFQNVKDLKDMVQYIGNIDNIGKKSKSKTHKIKKNEIKNYDIIIVCAAISDYTLSSEYKGKIPSGKKKINLELVPTEKIIKLIRKRAKKSYLVGFKAESQITEKKLIEKAKLRLTEWDLDLVVANDLAKVTANKSNVFMIHSSTRIVNAIGDKNRIAERIFDEILKNKNIDD